MIFENDKYILFIFIYDKHIYCLKYKKTIDKGSGVNVLEQKWNKSDEIDRLPSTEAKLCYVLLS